MISIIGIVLLIGIVKKNAIMMIDFALMAEREQGMTTYDAIFTAMPAALPSHSDDDHGGVIRRAAAGLRNGHRFGAATTAWDSPLSEV